MEDGVEAAGVSWLDRPGLIFTCCCLSSLEDGVEAAGVSEVGMVVRMLPEAVCPLWRMV